MNINIENCLKNELPPNLRWLGDQLIAHIRELRDRSARGEMYAATNEFLDCYRLGDNQCADHWSHTDATPVTVRKNNHGV